MILTKIKGDIVDSRSKFLTFLSRPAENCWCYCSEIFISHLSMFKSGHFDAFVNQSSIADFYDHENKYIGVIFNEKILRALY